MRFFKSTKSKAADADKTCSASGAQKTKTWAPFRLFRARKGAKNTVDVKQAEILEKSELENRIMKWLRESSRDEIGPRVDLMEDSSQIDAASTPEVPEDAEADFCQPLKLGDVNSDAFNSKKQIGDREDSTPSTIEAAQTPFGLISRPTCLVTPRRDILRPCNFQQDLLRLESLEGMFDLPSALSRNYGLTFTDSFRSLAAPLCGGAR
jgi:hypothetical protein